jgi:hypothetical protein
MKAVLQRVPRAAMLALVLASAAVAVTAGSASAAGKPII